jgi:AbrB family looped-hinge helix DNA binding protein
MTQPNNRRKVIKEMAKGQVTIPKDFWEALGTEAGTLLTISLVGDHLEIAPLGQGEEELRPYTKEDISRFLEEDRVDGETSRRVRELLRQGDL